ncbi:hypothetical protein BpHYR1_001900 [Brachionus plicatilis]|uniref:Uncharacterized protein n=1 Tax=Brachionus plicatilis TaxID=10195 RepID=A0A3M7SJK5_BRAPC|nr:hypothetical protein BpHYR1_001900 [Brachionus plicatilis]
MLKHSCTNKNTCSSNIIIWKSQVKTEPRNKWRNDDQIGFSGNSRGRYFPNTVRYLYSSSEPEQHGGKSFLEPIKTQNPKDVLSSNQRHIFSSDKGTTEIETQGLSLDRKKNNQKSKIKDSKNRPYFKNLI